MALSVEGVKEDDLRIMEEQSGNFSQVEEKEARAPDSQKDMGLTLDRVKDDLRITADQSGDDAKLERLIDVAVERVEKEAPTAPYSQKDMAALLFLSYLFHYGPHRGGSNLPSAWHKSGAAAIVKPWRKIRAGRIQAAGS